MLWPQRSAVAVEKQAALNKDECHVSHPVVREDYRSHALISVRINWNSVGRPDMQYTYLHPRHHRCSGSSISTSMRMDPMRITQNTTQAGDEQKPGGRSARLRRTLSTQAVNSPADLRQSIGASQHPPGYRPRVLLSLVKRQSHLHDHS